MAFISLAPSALPVFLRNENTAKLILKAVKHMNVDDPAILIQWNANGFNDNAVANCRNGVPGQTQADIVNYIVGNGGVDFNGLNTLLLFRNNLAIPTCQYQFPPRTHHQAGVADVCLSVCRINKLSAAGRIDYEPFDYPLMVISCVMWRKPIYGILRRGDNRRDTKIYLIFSSEIQTSIASMKHERHLITNRKNGSFIYQHYK
ncbi:hypothetical protein GLOIN_2v1883137 [Rhizophagus clarus]|uniref:Uncharacterized protein n=1 Tax=Rhizophagus clarus TaxID=94130 RepID=A0A8H3KNQ6_9GLOM|nr:hypothetical protein GLOIN_2v1883137 [Rhizophagus clarus]